MTAHAKDVLRERCAALVTKLGLAEPNTADEVTPLTGGVASDIATVQVGDLTYCAKFPLEKFRVAEEWHAPVNRNAAEYAWLEFAGKAVPGSAPSLFGRDADLNGFVMEFVQGDSIYLWKTTLLERSPVRGEAGKVGSTLGRIHAASAAPDFDESRFQNQQDFYDLRLEPYLVFTGNVHSDIADRLDALLDSLNAHDTVLIHGDISPKNILFRDGQPVFLDAECATMGDPCFDVAFCMNHLVLKAFHMPDRADDLLDECMSLWSSYAEQVNWESRGALEARVCGLLPALMLARVDGKSPVEYLNEQTRNRVREFSKPYVTNVPTTLQAFVAKVSDAYGV